MLYMLRVEQSEVVEIFRRITIHIAFLALFDMKNKESKPRYIR
jgi:hypothetical protein